MKAVVIPYAPRRQFLPLHERSQRWAIVVAHRRAGKTVACINELIRSAITCERPKPLFAYVAPHLNQAKDIAWSYLLEYTECFGDARKVNAGELWVELPPNRSRVRIYGADNPDRLRGLYLDGAVLDEFGDMEPEAWSKVIRPALSDREGWAIVVGTPKGRNAFYRLWMRADAKSKEGKHAGWLRMMLKASKTRRLSDKELADAKRTMSDDEYAQEYECSFDAAVRGAYWAPQIAELEAKGQITSVPYDPRLPVHTAWDLGMHDSTVIWFIQCLNGPAGEVRVIDVVKGEGVGLDWYVKRLQERDWVWGTHYLPHDVAQREIGSGKSRVEQLEALGVRCSIGACLPVDDGIQAVRAMLPRCWFDRDKCAGGIEALRMYRRKFDPRRQEFQAHPHHDWTSHDADALRCFAVDYRPPIKHAPIRYDNSWVA